MFYIKWKVVQEGRFLLQKQWKNAVLTTFHNSQWNQQRKQPNTLTVHRFWHSFVFSNCSRTNTGTRHTHTHWTPLFPKPFPCSYKRTHSWLCKLPHFSWHREPLCWKWKSACVCCYQKAANTCGVDGFAKNVIRSDCRKIE